jgi:chemotaxis response regulator CheB
MMTIRVLLVDNQDLVRAGFAMLLDSQPDLTVAGEAADGAAAVRLAREVPADVMVMDVRMPGLDGVAATREICQAAERPRVLILTTFDLDEYAFAALREATVKTHVGTSWPSSACATGSRPSSTPTRPASSPRRAPVSIRAAAKGPPLRGRR